MAEEIKITTEYMTLGQLLKHVGAIDTGGAAKNFLADHPVYVNGELEDRRGRKLYDGDTIILPAIGPVVISR